MYSIFLKKFSDNIIENSTEWENFVDITEFEEFEEMELNEILNQIKKLSSSDLIRGSIDSRVEHENDNIINLIVITGGEPLRQPIARLCEELIGRNFKVQISSSATNTNGVTVGTVRVGDGCTITVRGDWRIV